jgi:hypothetical protein
MFIVISLCARSRGDAAARKESKRRIDGENSRSAEPPPSSRRRSVGIRSLASASLRRLLLPLSPPQHVCTYQVSRSEALKKQKTTLSLLLNPTLKTAIHQHRSKTRGLGAGRKLKSHRRSQLWADKDYKKSHLGSEWKKPFAGASHAKGIVLEKM